MCIEHIVLHRVHGRKKTTIRAYLGIDHAGYINSYYGQYTLIRTKSTADRSRDPVHWCVWVVLGSSTRNTVSVNTGLLPKPINLLYGNKKFTVIYFLAPFCYTFYLYFFSRRRPHFFVLRNTLVYTLLLRACVYLRMDFDRNWTNVPRKHSTKRRLGFACFGKFENRNERRLNKQKKYSRTSGFYLGKIQTVLPINFLSIGRNTVCVVSTRLCCTRVQKYESTCFYENRVEVCTVIVYVY